MRKDTFVNGEIYHVFNKSIAGYIIFNNEKEFARMLDVVRYYQRENSGVSFSQCTRHASTKEERFNNSVSLRNKKRHVEIIAYCFMPTHFHLIVKQLIDSGISIFMNNLQNSYSRYFNTKHERKGPLWEGRFKSVLVESDEQLLHLTRYIHLNPVTAHLANKPEAWSMSSYSEYVSESKEKICCYDDVLDIESKSYREFLKDRVSYQRKLAEIKSLLLEKHTTA